jgi:hypothetical protein
MWAALADGNRQQIEAIEAEAARRGVRRDHPDRLHPRAGIPLEAAWSFFRGIGQVDRDLGILDPTAVPVYCR